VLLLKCIIQRPPGDVSHPVPAATATPLRLPKQQSIQHGRHSTEGIRGSDEATTNDSDFLSNGCGATRNKQ
jgi:hypothetical protein